MVLEQIVLYAGRTECLEQLDPCGEHARPDRSQVVSRKYLNIVLVLFHNYFY
jgi:hypothetical protein